MFTNFFRTPIVKNICERLLLKVNIPFIAKSLLLTHLISMFHLSGFLTFSGVIKTENLLQRLHFQELSFLADVAFKKNYDLKLLLKRPLASFRIECSSTIGLKQNIFKWCHYTIEQIKELIRKHLKFQGIIQEFNLDSHVSITLWCELCSWGVWVWERGGAASPSCKPPPLFCYIHLQIHEYEAPFSLTVYSNFSVLNLKLGAQTNYLLAWMFFFRTLSTVFPTVWKLFVLV